MPINSQFRMSSDMYFYGAAVEEVREDFWHHALPATEEVGAIRSADALRVVTYRLLAIAGAPFPDPRIAMLASFVVFVVLNFTLMYWLARELGAPRVASLLVSLTVLLWLRTPSYIDLFGVNPGAFGFYRSFVERFMSGSTDFESFNDNFRYAVLQTAICVLWAFLIALVRFDRRPSFRWGIPLAVLAVATAYAYLALPVIALLIGASYAVLALIRRDLERVRAFGLVAGAALLLAVIAGLPLAVAAVFSQSNPTLEIHTLAAALAPVDVLRARSLSVALETALLLLVWRLGAAATLLRFATGAAAAGALLFAGQFLPSLAAVSERLAVRGYANVALFVLMLLTVTAVIAAVRRWRDGIRLAPAGNALAAIVIVMIAAPAAIGDSRLAATLASSEELRIPTGQWEVYRYLQDNARPNTVVLAYDWEDVQLLPVYTHVDLYFGDVSFTGRSQTDEVRRYLRAWKFMGYSDSVLRTRVETAAKEGARLGGADPKHALERPAAEGPMLLRHLIYDPYIKEFDGTPIRDERTRELTPSFIERFFALMPSDTVDLGADRGVRFLLLSRDYEELRPVPYSPIPGFDLVLRNDVRTLYERQPAH